MIDSGTKHSDNRIHLYDPVGLITDGYGSFRPSSHSVRPRRQALSYDNITENTNNSNTTLGIKSYDSFEVDSLGLRSYDSFEVDSLGLRSLNESFNSEANGGITSSHDNSNTTTTTTTMTTTMIDKDRSDESLSFVVADAADDDDQSDDSTPRLWRPSAPANPKPPRSPLQLPTSRLKSINSSNSHPTSPKSFYSSHLHPTSPTSVNSTVSHPTSPKSANSSLSHPTSPKSANSSPLHPTSPKSVNFSPINPTKSVNSPSHTSTTHHHYQTLSPNSRTQAIANGRKELMDMVRDLPESFYELSLKDIVDKKPETEMKKEIDVKSEEKRSMKESTMAKETKKQKKKSSSKKVNKSESKKKMVRSRSVDNGKFLLKTSVFPILGSRKNKKSLTTTSSFKVAPMPKTETSAGTVKAGEKDWWRRKSCISSESEVSNGLSSHSTSSRSSTCSSRSNSGNGRRSNRFLPNCCLFNSRMIRGKK